MKIGLRGYDRMECRRYGTHLLPWTIVWCLDKWRKAFTYLCRTQSSAIMTCGVSSCIISSPRCVPFLKLLGMPYATLWCREDFTAIIEEDTRNGRTMPRQCHGQFLNWNQEIPYVPDWRTVSLWKTQVYKTIIFSSRMDSSLRIIPSLNINPN